MVYNNTPINMYKSKVDFSTTSQLLITDFIENKNIANLKYVDHIIQVNGVIDDIAYKENTRIITLKYQDMDSSIICLLQNQENNKLKKGQSVSIKGICTDFLLDVMLINCVVVNTK
jgi:hypothetical protein